MADVTNELIHEVLKGIKDRLSKIEDSQGDIREELIGVRLHMHAKQGEINSILSRTSAIKSWLTKIERRLDIIGEPAE
ncbi:hypothetical protein [Hoeflea sp.]|uniref:hypothetical protein n=1 Tax=Hoeflea sp. TaxID=1940281 RepID=UPI0019C44E6D|nr:hypothetical protein [Hoeflea sp.]MBC7282402.1 hypothetical protein [Hoeflea sp.]